MKYSVVILFAGALLAVVFLAGCVGQTPNMKDCGTNLTCIRAAEKTCEPAFGAYTNETLGIAQYAEIHGTDSNGNCMYLILITSLAENITLNATCALPKYLWGNNDIVPQELCDHCTGTFTTALIMQGVCEDKGITASGVRYRTYEEGAYSTRYPDWPQSENMRWNNDTMVSVFSDSAPMGFSLSKWEDPSEIGVILESIREQLATDDNEVATVRVLSPIKGTIYSTGGPDYERKLVYTLCNGFVYSTYLAYAYGREPAGVFDMLKESTCYGSADGTGLTATQMHGSGSAGGIGGTGGTGGSGIGSTGGTSGTGGTDGTGGTGGTPGTGSSLTVTRTGLGSGIVTTLDKDINCGTDCNELYGPNDNVILYANWSVGSWFGGWSGIACDDNYTYTYSGNYSYCSFKMNQSRTVTARFNIAPTMSVTSAKCEFVRYDPKFDSELYGTYKITVAGTAASGEIGTKAEMWFGGPYNVYYQPISFSCSDWSANPTQPNDDYTPSGYSLHNGDAECVRYGDQGPETSWTYSQEFSPRGYLINFVFGYRPAEESKDAPVFPGGEVRFRGSLKCPYFP